MVLVAKGGKRFGAVAALTGLGGAGSATALHRENHDHAAREAAGGTVGAWAGQGAYQGAGYGAKWRAQAKKEPLATRSQRDKKLKAVKREHGAYTPAMERHYPKELPEFRTHRVLGYTHRGRLGTAAGGTATALGAIAGLRAARGKEPVRKELVDHERPYSATRIAGVGVGSALTAAGVSRMPSVRGYLGYGTASAGNRNVTRATANRVSGAIATRATAGGIMVHRNTGIGGMVELVPARLRPYIVAGAGVSLIRRSLPVRHDTFRPVRGRPSFGDN